MNSAIIVRALQILSISAILLVLLLIVLAESTKHHRVCVRWGPGTLRNPVTHEIESIRCEEWGN